MTILVTGASGFIGRALCNRLFELNFSVRALSRNIPLFNHNIETIVLNPENYLSNLPEILFGVNTIVHLASRVHMTNDYSSKSLDMYRKVNVDYTLNLARQAAHAGVKSFIFISSVKVNGDFTEGGRPFNELDVPAPTDAYGLSKYEAELGLKQIASEFGIKVVIIRPPLVYGPGVKANFATLVRAVRFGYPLPFGAFKNKRSFVALDNLVDFIVICIDNEKAANQIFLVSDQCDLSTIELVYGIARAAGVSVRLFPLPLLALLAGATLLGGGDVVRRLSSSLQVDSSKASNLLGWTPPLSVDEGLRRIMTQ